MKKQIVLSLLMLISIATTTAQVSSDYFEVYTKQAHSRSSSGFSFNKDSILARITGVSDTASTFATFVLSVNDLSLVDSLSYTLTNSHEQIVFTGSADISSLQSNASFKINGNTLYYTVGPFPYLKRFTASASVRGTDGISTPIKSFAKN